MNVCDVHIESLLGAPCVLFSSREEDEHQGRGKGGMIVDLRVRSEVSHV